MWKTSSVMSISGSLVHSAAHFVAEYFQSCPQVWRASGCWWRGSCITWSRPRWIRCTARRGSFPARQDERQRRRLPRAATPSCGLLFRRLLPLMSSPGGRGLGGSSSSIHRGGKCCGTCSGTEAWISQGGKGGFGLSHWPSGRSGSARWAVCALVHDGHCVFLRREHQRQGRMKREAFRRSGRFWETGKTFDSPLLW